MSALSVVGVFVRLRRHWPLWIVLGLAIGMRLWFVYAYPYAFFFPDSRTYVASAQDGFPNVIRPWGYSALIVPLLHQPYIRIAIIQHLIGLAVIVTGYAFLRRRGCKPWLSALAMVPLALDARVLTLEHYVLAETAYLAFTAAGLFLIAWRDRVGWIAAALGGALLACAALTRSVGLPILALAAVYLLVRRAGILRIIAYVVPVVALLGGYMIFYHQQWGAYSMGQYQGRFLYARVVSIADCDKLKLTDDQRRLCLPNPTHSKSWEQRPDQFIWAAASPAYRFYPNKEDDPALQKYALTVIEQEPGAFLALVARQTAWHLIWRAPLVDDGQCLADQWLPPQRPGDSCQARYYLPVEIGLSPAPSFLVDNPQAKALHAYGTWATTPGPLYAIGVLVTLFAAVWRFRRRPWRDAADALLFTLGGFGLLVVSVATSLFDYRYSEPAVLMIPVGLAIAVTRIVALAKTPAAHPETPAAHPETPAPLPETPAPLPATPAPLPATPATSDDVADEPPTTPIERAQPV